MDLDGLGQAERVASGEISPLELVDAAIERIEKLNPQLNAVITPLYDKARAQVERGELGEGPFRGVPFLVKDVVCHTAGDPYHCGMRFLRDLGWTEARDSWLAQRYRAAGFVIVGKTNTPELAFAPTTEPLAYGTTRNPWNPGLSPGGSSGGAAAAVASGMVPIAHGNDMGGSIRIPASACGLVGLKPTRARNTLGPDFGELWWALTHEHVLTRSVRDSAAVLDCSAGRGPGDPYGAPPPSRPFLAEVGADPGRLRVGVWTGGVAGVPVDPACTAAVENTARQLAALGHHVEEAWPEILARPHAFSATGIVLMVAIARELGRWAERTGRPLGRADVEATTWVAAEMGRGIDAPGYVAATERLQQEARELCSWWAGGFDLLLGIVTCSPTPPLGPLGPKGGEALEVLQRWARFAPNAIPFNVSGQPAVSLPLHQTEQGIPIGVQLVADYGREDLLLRVASQLEEASPWASRWPGISAE